MSRTVERCELCRREVAGLTRHHLVPRTRHANKKNKRDFSRDAVREIARLCKPCHKQIHSVLDEKELERSFHSIEALAAHPEIAKFIVWIRRRPAGTAVRSHATRRRRDTRR